MERGHPCPQRTPRVRRVSIERVLIRKLGGKLCGQEGSRAPYNSHMESKLKGWHSRGYLPHFDGGEVAQFITIHLGDSLPVSLIKKWKKQLESEPDNIRELELYERIEKYLDKGYGACYLRDKRIASLVQDSLLFFESKKYYLRAWIVMPNHAHFLLRPSTECSLSEILHSIKSYTSNKANKILGREGEFWQEDYFDRYIRSEKHYFYTINYIENNPVKAGLCKRPEEWVFSSYGARKSLPATDASRPSGFDRGTC